MPTNHTRYVSAGKESTFNTPVAATAVGEVESESFQQSYDVLKRADMNYYNAAKAVVSKKIAEGSISMALQPDKFVLMMLHGIMGGDTPGSSATDQRTFDELPISSTASLPSYTFRIGRDDKEHIFAGQVIESVSVSASIGEYAMMTVNTVGAEQNSSTATLATAVPTYTKDAAHFVRTFVRFEGVSGTAASEHSGLVQSIDFEIKTGRDLDNSYALGSDTCIRAPPATLREVTGSITFHKALLTADATENEPFFDELMGATKANGQAVSNPGSGTPAISAFFVADADNFIKFDFFKVHFEMPETSVSGRDSQTMTVNFHGLYDLGDANKVMQITCKSEDALSDYDA